MGNPSAPECDGIRGAIPDLNYGSAVGRKISNVIAGPLASCVGKVTQDRLVCPVIAGFLQAYS